MTIFLKKKDVLKSQAKSLKSTCCKVYFYYIYRLKARSPLATNSGVLYYKYITLSNDCMLKKAPLVVEFIGFYSPLESPEFQVNLIIKRIILILSRVEHNKYVAVTFFKISENLKRVRVIRLKFECPQSTIDVNFDSY